MELWVENRRKRQRRKEQGRSNLELPVKHEHCLSRYSKTICRSHANEPVALLPNLIHLDVALRKSLMETPATNTEVIVPLEVFHPFCFCYQFSLEVISWRKTITKSWGESSNHQVSFKLSVFCAEKLPRGINLLMQNLYTAYDKGLRANQSKMPVFPGSIFCDGSRKGPGSAAWGRRLVSLHLRLPEGRRENRRSKLAFCLELPLILD